MRWLLVVWITFAAAAAHAQAPGVDALPAPTVLPIVPIDHTHLELGLYGGIASTDSHNSDYDAAGIGPSVDLEIGARRSWFSALAYVEASQETSTTGQQNLNVRMWGFGGRLRVHFYGAFAGIGLGVTSGHQSGYYMNSFGRQNTDPSDDPGGIAVEAQAGYTFPRFHGIAPRLLATIEASSDMDEMTMTATRLELGVVF